MKGVMRGSYKSLSYLGLGVKREEKQKHLREVPRKGYCYGYSIHCIKECLKGKPTSKLDCIFSSKLQNEVTVLILFCFVFFP